MNNFLNQLNLTPQERRIVVVIFLVVIVVLNLLFVWPHFGEWGSINKQLESMRGTIANDYRLIALDTNPTNGFQVQVKKLSRLEGSSVMENPVDPSIQLGNTIRAQEIKTGVNVSSFGTGRVHTNEFFEEISTAIEVQTQEPQLVSFLYNMGMDPAMIRVASLDLQPDDRNTRYKLKGSITLTANYTKRPPTAVSAALPGKPVAANKPAPAPVNKMVAPPAPAQNVKQSPPGPPPPGQIKRPREAGKPNLPNRPLPFPRHGQGQQGQPGQKPE
jgi:Tfp pilus assembly protein PilO